MGQGVEGKSVTVDPDEGAGEGVGAPLRIREGLQRVESTGAQPLVGKSPQRCQRHEPGEVGRHRYRPRSIGQSLGYFDDCLVLDSDQEQVGLGERGVAGDQRARSRL